MTEHFERLRRGIKKVYQSRQKTRLALKYAGGESYLSYGVTLRRVIMNEDILKGKWNELKGYVQKKWGKLTDDDFVQINGDRTKLVGKIQTAYGIERDAVEKQLKDLEDRRAA